MLRVAVVGCGVIGTLHFQILQQHPEVQVFLCDTDPLQAQRLQPGAPVWDHPHRLLEEVPLDLVSLCTPHPSHPDLIVAALAHQVPVLCEKPLCTTVADLERLKRLAATDANHQVTGIFQHRYAPAAQRLKELLAAGRFGTLLRTQARFRCDRGPDYYARAPWRGTQRGEGGGVVLNQGIHTLDLWQWWLGDLTAVSGAISTRNPFPGLEVEDTLEGHGSEWASVQFASGLEGRVQMHNRPGFPWEPQLEVEGTEGSFCYTPNDNGRFLSLQHPDPEVLQMLQQATRPPQPPYAKPEYSDLHQVQIDDVLARVQQQQPPQIPLSEALKANEAVLAFYQSSRQQAAVSLPLSSAGPHA